MAKSPAFSVLRQGVTGVRRRSTLFGCNVFKPAEHHAGFEVGTYAAFAGSNDALIFLKGRWRTGPATAADASALGAVCANDLSKGGRYEFHSSRPQPRTDADSHHGNPRRHQPRTSTSRVRTCRRKERDWRNFSWPCADHQIPMGMDGLGGNTILQSKVAIVSPSSRPGADIDYTFIQIFPDQPAGLSYKMNCGNISSGVPVFALMKNTVHASSRR
jgi:hypothetical protein